MRIDWQSYLDGSLSEAETAEAERQLRENPEAVRELEDLKSFIQSVRTACLSEEVPFARLESLMPSVPQSRPRLAWIGAGGLALAASAALAFMALRTNPIQSGEGWSTSDPVAASQWASNRLGSNLPPMNLGDSAKLVYVHEGKQKCCFDYRVEEQVYHLNFARRPRSTTVNTQDVTLPNGVAAQLGKGVTWQQAGFTLYVVGPKDEVSLKLASEASKLLDRA